MPTQPTPLDLSNSAAEALAGTAIAPLNATLAPVGATAASSPSYLARQANLFRHIIQELDSNLRVRKDGTLTIGVRPGRLRDSSGVAKTFDGASTQALTNNATNSIWLDTTVDPPTLQIGTSGFPGTATTYMPLAEYVTSGGAISTSDTDADRRDWVRNWIPASSSSPTGTAGTSFTLDDDNSGAAAANLQIRANRGSSNAEDACVEWVEADGCWRVRSQHTTATLAPLDASAIKISGTTALDSNGAAKVAAAVAGDGLAHTTGVLSVGVDGTTIEINSDALRIKDGGVSTTKLSDTVADSLAQVSIPDSTGTSPRQVTIQVTDLQGNALATTVYLQIGVFDDADGATLSANATIAVGGGVGSLLRSLTATKELAVKTNSSGQVRIDVTAVAGTYYLIASVGRRSQILGCGDIGTIVVS